MRGGERGPGSFQRPQGAGRLLQDQPQVPGQGVWAPAAPVAVPVTLCHIYAPLPISPPNRGLPGITPHPAGIPRMEHSIWNTIGA